MNEDLIENTFLEQFCSRNIPAYRKIRNDIKIGIAGCGGLGSNIAVMLVRSGIGNLNIVDYDKVEASNLNRQNFIIEDINKDKIEVLDNYLKSINPFVQITKQKIKITSSNLFDIFIECKIVIEAFDSVEDKSMMIEEFSNLKNNEKYLIGASGLAGIGSADNIATKKFRENIYICGDFASEPEMEEGVMAPRVMITAGHQANVALRLIKELSGL